MSLKIENRDVVVPGELIAEGDYLLGEGTFREDKNVFANVLGLLDAKENFVKVIPLSGRYIPEQGDLVIGIITDITFSGWELDINSVLTARLSLSNGTERYIDLSEESLSDIYDIGDVVLAKVDSVSRDSHATLTMKDRSLYKFKAGRLLSVSPSKVPRIIGRKGTMVSTVKDLTGCRITVGQNGRVWITGTNPDLAITAIRKIEELAHTSGLTDYITGFIEKEKGKSGDTGTKGLGGIEEKPKTEAESTSPTSPASLTPEEKPKLEKKTVEELEKEKEEN